ncbi:MFS transporter [Nostoc sp. FACHB-87]|uniref:MFS transporter n=1 Tax=Nostocales TaxID=1161 RepID=UPI001686CA17|nr:MULTISPECIES: MFS transporter [Nostocales]MBD2457746.1 MFS transporter [Nostoc sp. FACHB-87]MBD2478206.1 MFS transporter [Anabaena sp. FACHB-83]MBD2486825.1 MFS transporter [Aulosira sp. FACHB-615]
MDSVQLETAASLTLETLEIPQIVTPPTTLVPTPKPAFRFPKDAIRTSLRASTVDAVLATVFSITTGGILLSNFLVELDASPVVFGLLSSIPMLVNLIQPLGAYLSERTTSRFRYALGIYGTSRLLWLILAIAIAIFSWGSITSQQLVVLTLLIVLATHLLGGLGCASWMSWLAIIVPRRLRGRYFGIRNSAVSLTNLICMPLAGLIVSHWDGGNIQGYGIVLLIGVIFGIVSIGCQYFKIDINPQLQNSLASISPNNTTDELVTLPTISIWKNYNFLIFLIYISLWMFAVHLSAPFFNLYMLDTLNIDVSWVTLYGSLQAGANLLMLIWWGKLADRVGNLPILIFVGILVGLTPILWLGINASQLDIWLWLPLLHILAGITWAAIDLCNNNLQLAIAPMKNQSIYFAIAAAVAGASGALGTTIGSFIAQFALWGGLLGLFALSGLLRLAALVPLFFVQEPGR